MSMNILSFHESTVTKFFTKKNNFVIGLEGVLTDSSSNNAELIVENVSKILIDSVPIVGNLLKMPFKDGEVLTLELSEGKVFVLIEWNDFSSGVSFTQSYEVSGNKVKKAIF